MLQLANMSDRSQRTTQGHALRKSRQLSRVYVCAHHGTMVPLLHCAYAAILHLVYKCPVFQPLRQQYAALLPTNISTTSFDFAQQDHTRVSNFVLDWVDFLRKWPSNLSDQQTIRCIDRLSIAISFSVPTLDKARVLPLASGSAAHSALASSLILHATTLKLQL